MRGLHLPGCCSRDGQESKAFFFEEKKQKTFDSAVAGSLDIIVSFSSRLAGEADIAALRRVMDDAITYLQQDFLTAAQIDASRQVMGLDTQLIADATYFVVLDGTQVAGCGGWSRRATLFGGDHTAGRSAALLDPAHDAARIRAMYTAPAYARQGVGRLILSLCETAAAAEGFRYAELAATAAGVPLYSACGYAGGEPIEAGIVPLMRMRKRLL